MSFIHIFKIRSGDTQQQNNSFPIQFLACVSLIFSYFPFKNEEKKIELKMVEKNIQMFDVET